MDFSNPAWPAGRELCFRASHRDQVDWAEKGARKKQPIFNSVTHTSENGTMAESCLKRNETQTYKCWQMDCHSGKEPKSPLTQRWCAHSLAAGSPGQGPSASRASPCKQPPTAKGGLCTQNLSQRGGAN